MANLIFVLSRKIAGIVLTVVVFAATLLLWPRSYSASATIMVEPQKLLGSYAPASLASSGISAFDTLVDTLLSQDEVVTVISTHRLYPDLRESAGMEEALKRFRGDLTIEMSPATGSGVESRVRAVRVAFRSDRPAVAAAVANHMASSLVRANLMRREREASVVVRVLDGEIAAVKERLVKGRIALRRAKSETDRVLADHDLSAARGQYIALRGKRVEAELSMDLERNQLVERFAVVSLARAPESSGWPFRQ